MSRYRVKRNPGAGGTSLSAETKKPRKLNLKSFFGVLAAIVIFYAVYLLCFRLDFKEIIHIYAVILLVCGILFGVFNRGFSQKPLTRDDLPPEWDDEACEAALAKDKKLRRTSKFFLVPAIAVLFTFMLDLLYLQVIVPVFGG